MSIIKKFNELNSEHLNESQIRVDNITYDVIRKNDGDLIMVSNKGILGKDNKLIEWKLIEELMEKYK